MIQDWRANYYEAIRERDEAEAKLEKVAKLVEDLALVPSASMISQALDNVLFPCECPDEHCGECGCCPDEVAS